MEIATGFHNQDGVNFLRLKDDSIIIAKFTQEQMQSVKHYSEYANLLKTGKYVWMHHIRTGMEWVSITASMGNNDYELAKKLFNGES